MKEALTMEEQAVKNINLKKENKVPESTADPISEKEIDGEIWVKKEESTEISDAEIGSQLNSLFNKAVKGRQRDDVVKIMRNALKKLAYKSESNGGY